MTMIFDSELQIAAGFNNAAGLESIAGIVAAGDTRPFVAPRAWFNFSPGQQKIRLNQRLYFRGTLNAAWIFRFMTKNQWDHFSVTWCTSGYDGEVTIRTRLRDPNSFSNANAIVYLPPPADTIPLLGKINDIRISIVDIEVL
jgi:hypothetical protein